MKQCSDCKFWRYAFKDEKGLAFGHCKNYESNRCHWTLAYRERPCSFFTGEEKPPQGGSGVPPKPPQKVIIVDEDDGYPD